ncbi:hypothetical protein Bbelb_399440 [Branchiostoma belcheri]|nr:hypothetical protein Bbelb_399440 [Branchiostoma belcheri]
MAQRAVTFPLSSLTPFLALDTRAWPSPFMYRHGIRERKGFNIMELQHLSQEFAVEPAGKNYQIPRRELWPHQPSTPGFLVLYERQRGWTMLGGRTVLPAPQRYRAAHDGLINTIPGSSRPKVNFAMPTLRSRLQQEFTG